MLEREPHVEVAARLVALVDNGRIEGLICATAVTTLYSVGAKDLGRSRAHDQVAHAAGVSAIVTRNGRDFAKATIPVFEPHEPLAAIAARSD
jgi:hypothetical protein